jgi:hypothetical protein
MAFSLRSVIGTMSRATKKGDVPKHWEWFPLHHDRQDQHSPTLHKNHEITPSYYSFLPPMSTGEMQKMKYEGRIMNYSTLNLFSDLHFILHLWGFQDAKIKKGGQVAAFTVSTPIITHRVSGNPGSSARAPASPRSDR